VLALLTLHCGFSLHRVPQNVHPLFFELICQKLTDFTARCYASAVLAMGLCLSVCLSVSVSVTGRNSTKTAKRRITQTTPHDSLGTLVFCCQRYPRNSTVVTPYEGAECRWGGQNRRLRPTTNNRLHLENGKR